MTVRVYPSGPRDHGSLSDETWDEIMDQREGLDVTHCSNAEFVGADPVKSCIAGNDVFIQYRDSTTVPIEDGMDVQLAEEVGIPRVLVCSTHDVMQDQVFDRWDFVTTSFERAEEYIEDHFINGDEWGDSDGDDFDDRLDAAMSSMGINPMSGQVEDADSDDWGWVGEEREVEWLHEFIDEGDESTKTLAFDNGSEIEFENNLEAPTSAGLGHFEREFSLEFTIGEEDVTDSEHSGDDYARDMLHDTGELIHSNEDTHGDCVENMEHIARGWTWYLRGEGLLDDDEEITGPQAARCMSLLKDSRTAVGDNYDTDEDRDGAAYHGIAAACEVDRGNADESDLTVEDYHDHE